MGDGYQRTGGGGGGGGGGGVTSGFVDNAITQAVTGLADETWVSGFVDDAIAAIPGADPYNDAWISGFTDSAITGRLAVDGVNTTESGWIENAIATHGVTSTQSGFVSNAVTGAGFVNSGWVDNAIIAHAVTNVQSGFVDNAIISYQRPGLKSDAWVSVTPRVYRKVLSAASATFVSPTIPQSASLVRAHLMLRGDPADVRRDAFIRINDDATAGAYETQYHFKLNNSGTEGNEYTSATRSRFGSIPCANASSGVWSHSVIEFIDWNCKKPGTNRLTFTVHTAHGTGSNSIEWYMHNMYTSAAPYNTFTVYIDSANIIAGSTMWVEIYE